jgi:hypothetical protein
MPILKYIHTRALAYRQLSSFGEYETCVNAGLAPDRHPSRELASLTDPSVSKSTMAASYMYHA